jgi:hypothetical protein
MLEEGVVRGRARFYGHAPSSSRRAQWGRVRVMLRIVSVSSGNGVLRGYVVRKRVVVFALQQRLLLLLIDC